MAILIGVLLGEVAPILPVQILWVIYGQRDRPDGAARL